MHVIQDLLVLAVLGALFVAVLVGLRATRPLDDSDEHGKPRVEH